MLPKVDKKPYISKIDYNGPHIITSTVVGRVNSSYSIAIPTVEKIDKVAVGKLNSNGKANNNS